MVQLTEEEMKKAFIRWSRNSYFPNCDEKLKSFLNCEASGSWLKSIREALFLSHETVGKNLGMSRAGYKNLEDSEDSMAITLASLIRAAEAMDCELVYAIRPKSRRLISNLVWEKIVPEAIQHTWITNCDPKNRAGALEFLVRKKLGEAKFREKMGWSYRANKPSS